MRKAALLFALIFALFAGTWTTPCIPGLEYDTPLPAHPAGEWSIFHGHPITYGGTATIWTGPLAKPDGARFHEIAGTAWISGYPGPHYAAGKYYTETARIEQSSQELQALTQLSESQSRALTSYCGLPKEYPPAETTQEILAQANWQLADAALVESAERPDAWQVADSMLELGIGICALLGGVYGTRAVRFLQDARAKSQALKEVVEGNELFKQQNEPQTAAFKDAHQHQSPETRQLVAALRG